MKSEKYSIFNYMTASARFDTSNKSNIFDELNENTERKQGPSNARVAGLVADKTAAETTTTTTASKIEFDTKTAVASETNIFSQDSLTAKADHTTQTKGKESKGESAESNIYLQVGTKPFF